VFGGSGNDVLFAGKPGRGSAQATTYPVRRATTGCAVTSETTVSTGTTATTT